jgi:phosphatidylinositol-4,5-bisphosphate 3-kinase
VCQVGVLLLRLRTCAYPCMCRVPAHANQSSCSRHVLWGPLRSLLFPSVSPSHRTETSDDSLDKANDEYFELHRSEIVRLLRTDPLYELNPSEMQLLWRCRDYLMHEPLALPLFLQSVSWRNGRHVSEARRLMTRWQRPLPVQALQLLDVKFPDPPVR